MRRKRHWRRLAKAYCSVPTGVTAEGIAWRHCDGEHDIHIYFAAKGLK
jgi:hypothetical protein